MTKAGHVVVGFSVALLLELDPVFAVLGAILPDKDLMWEKPVGKRTLWNAHRGFTHHVYLIPALLLTAALGIFTLEFPYSYILASFCAGYVSHILADAFTPLGVPYTLRYYPRFSLFLFRTGSLVEWMLIFTFACLILYFGQERVVESLSRQQAVVRFFLGE